MATNFPGSNDVFTEPSSPGSTALSSAGTGSRNHTQHHADLGNAIEAMQLEATLLVHSHDGSTVRHGSKLSQANTHQSADTDAGLTSIHHTLGAGANQSAAGNHTHIQSTSHNSPDTDSAISALHHTLGTGANQAAAGNHVHSHSLPVYFTASGTFTKATYPGLYAIEVELVGGGAGSGYAAATGASQYSWGIGGPGGAYVKALILAGSLGANETVTVGAAGAGGTAGTPNGIAGGNTSFGAFCTAGGGPSAGARSATTAGTSYQQNFGGSPSGTYDIGISGQGQGSIYWSASGIFYNGGALDGQPSGGPYGQKTISGYGFDTGSSSGSGSTGGGWGSGASAPFNFTSTTAKNGSPGTQGLCIVRLIF